MSANPKFDLDLKFGQAIEKQIADLFFRCRIEVKADLAANGTGNVCVECYQLGPGGKLVPSGINRTESEWYCFAFDSSEWPDSSRKTQRNAK